jgi:predicted nucleotidyltransferase component of viral defense system
VKDAIRQLLAERAPATSATGLVREYLQARILGELQRAGAMIPLAFHGGTALRFLYGIPRHSEDLDFALERADASYDLRGYVAVIRAAFAKEAYAVEAKLSERRTVHAAFVKFPGLLHELGLTADPRRVLSIKLEVDTRPPSGAGLATTVVRRHVVLQLQHHDKASLLAGKLHAVLQRSHPKGRDLYDLLWYLGDASWPAPNLEMLNAALDQSGWGGGRLAPKSWRRAVRERVASMDFRHILADVDPFLEVTADREALTRDNLLRLLAP